MPGEESRQAESCVHVRAHARLRGDRGCEHMIGMWACDGSRVILVRYDIGAMGCGACSNVGIMIRISRRVKSSRRGDRFQDDRTGHGTRTLFFKDFC